MLATRKFAPNSLLLDVWLRYQVKLPNDSQIRLGGGVGLWRGPLLFFDGFSCSTAGTVSKRMWGKKKKLFVSAMWKISKRWRRDNVSCGVYAFRT